MRRLGLTLLLTVLTAGLGHAATPRLAPLAFVKFCLAYPAECVASGEPDARLPARTAELAELEKVNREVNRSITGDRFRAERETVPLWRIYPARGDCNDYAVTKRHALLARGLPSSALLLAAVETKTGEGHLVLIVRTAEADLVLDNLSPAIKPWRETGYRLIGRQGSRDPKQWES